MITALPFAGALVLAVAMLLALRAEHSRRWLAALVLAPVLDVLLAVNVGGPLVGSFPGAAAILCGLVAIDGAVYLALLRRWGHPAPRRGAGTAALGTLVFSAALAVPLYIGEVFFVCGVLTNGCD